MAKFKLPADHDDFPGDSPERKAAALASAGALLSPDDVISDYGNFDQDWNEDEHNEANGSSGRNAGQGPYASKIEDVDRFYESTRAQAIRIRRYPSETSD
ncbi:MAG: hypothetical protein HC771_22315 [Synechococcales cyanobacterium CRU_2_2]|nr:hypothetical protein [Synechococcales cyanobacterium CRU_2_2]